MDASPFAHSRTGTHQVQDDISNLVPSNEPETEDVSPLNDLQADLGRRLQVRRSMSTPDLASLPAEPEQSVEHAPSFSFQAGKSWSNQGTISGPRRSVSMSDDHFLRMWSHSELISLAERMQQGLHVRDRVYHFKFYRNSFAGADAVRWILSNGLAGSEGEALLLGNDMLHAGLLHHVKFKRPFQNNGNLYRFLNVRSGASDVTEGASTPSSQAEGHEFARFERLYDEMWARRGVQKMDQAAPLLGTQHEGWFTAAELAQLQRKVADLAAELEEYKALNDLMRDSMTLQLQNEQQLFALLQSRLERAIRRGTWLAIHLQIVVVLLLVLAFVLAQNFLSQQQHTFLNSLAQAAVLVLTVLCALSALTWQPWQLPAAKKVPEAVPEALKTTTPAAATEESLEPEAAGGWRVDMGADATAGGRNEAEEAGAQLRALRKDDAEKLLQPPSEQDLTGWPDEPLLLRAAPLPSLCMQQGANPYAIRINDGRRIEFETDLFRGCAVIWAQGLSSAPEGLFAGERRKTSITVQGRFKQDLAVEDVVSGQEFARQPKNLPAMWLVDKVLIKLAKKISPSMDIGPLSAPYLLAPVLALAQLVNVSRPGEEPDPSQPTPEDLRLFDPSLTNNSGGPMNALKRKKHFWNKKNRAGRTFTREHVWTFQMYQHFVDMGAYELNTIYGFDLGRHLDGQPLQFMLKDRRSGGYLMNFHAWHRKLLPAAQAAEETPSQ